MNCKEDLIGAAGSRRRSSRGFPEPLFLPCLSVPKLLGGKQLSATVIDLNPWVEYEFRVLATNSIGTGEPSRPSKKARTRETRTSGHIPALLSSTEPGLKLLFKLNKTLMLLQPRAKHLCSHQAEQTLHILIPNLKRYMNILTGPTLLRQLRG